MKKQENGRTLERLLARELSEKDLRKIYGGAVGTTSCSAGCADDCDQISY